MPSFFEPMMTPAPFNRAPSAALLVALLAAPALAQTPPDAGGALRDLKPLPASPAPAAEPRLPSLPIRTPTADRGGMRFVLKSVRLTGVTVFPPESLAETYADRIGKEVGLADLQEIAARIASFYRAAGYPLAQAVVPVQEVTAGAAEITVLEGRLGRLTVDVAPEAGVPEHLVRQLLSGLVPGQPVRQDALERGMLLVSDLPGVAAESSLEAGVEPGTVDLTVGVQRRRAWDLTVDADNYGSRATGEYRIGALGRLNSPLGLGDNLDLRLTESSHNGTTYGRVAYEMPLGGAGTRVGVGFAHLRYELGAEFAPLDASGEADVWEFSVLHPFIRSRARTLIGRLSVEERWLDDRLGAFGISSDKRLRDVGAGFAYDGRDGFAGGGYTSAAATYYFSDLDIRSEPDRSLDAGAGGRHTAGSGQRLVYQLSRLNSVTENGLLFAGITGQWASRNLDSAARIALGGPRGVRAYAMSEAVVDEGFVATLEYRYALRPDVTVSGFGDYGWGRIDADGPRGTEPNTLTRRGYGVGLFWAAPYGMTLRSSLAWRGNQVPADGSDRVPRLFVQLIKGF